MHEHSLIAFNEIMEDGSKEARKKAILDVYAGTTRPMRDYDVLQVLFPGSSDMNLVRPRITELIYEDKKIYECGKARSHSGNRPVRLTKLITNQLTLF